MGDGQNTFNVFSNLRNQNVPKGPMNNIFKGPGPAGTNVPNTLKDGSGNIAPIKTPGTDISHTATNATGAQNAAKPINGITPPGHNKGVRNQVYKQQTSIFDKIKAGIQNISGIGVSQQQGVNNMLNKSKFGQQSSWGRKTAEVLVTEDNSIGAGIESNIMFQDNVAKPKETLGQKLITGCNDKKK